MDLVLPFLVSCVCMIGGVKQPPPPGNIIKLNSSLVPNTSWPSPSGRFAFGFYHQGSGFMVGIWLVGKSTTDNKVVWTAHRDEPPVTSNAKLVLNERGLQLMNSTSQETIIEVANASVNSASMLDSGNFVLNDHEGNNIWQSFMYPTDTILGGQSLNSGGQLISSSSENNHSTGKYHLRMQEDGNLVLYPLNAEDRPGVAYWSSDSNNGVKHFLYLNSSIGLLQIINLTDCSIIKTLEKGRYFFPDQNYNDDGDNEKNNSVYSARLDVDGNFRLYAHLFEPGGGGFHSLARLCALENRCKIKGFCGFNSYCTFNDAQPDCICLPGTDFIDPHQRILGCRRNYSEAYCEGGMANKRHYNITSMEHIAWTSGTFYSCERISKDECSTTCLEDCNCEAALFEDGMCKKQKLPLKFLLRDNDQISRLSAQNHVFSSILFLKVGVRGLEVVENQNMFQTTSINGKEPVVQVLLLSFSLLACSCFSLTIAGIFLYKFRVLRYKRMLENGNWGQTDDQLTPIIFSYKELRRATNGFKQELGRGSFGAVYKGTLHKGRKTIAVKRLEKLIEDGEGEFQAEMRAIGRSHHRNLVHLLGYCAEDSKRLLVYEYMANDSLAKILFNTKFNHPNWHERMRIALDVAKGILYLHDECESPIIHCDIKPQNILMDDSWTAKISDFGLAKLLMGDQTRTSTEARGTRGYMAPEWHKNTSISLKVDVYSYGIMLLEIAFCRKNFDTNVSKPEETVLSTWVYRCFAANELDKLVLGEEVDKQSLYKMVMVALWCIQDEPALRPPMKSVVMMLEGIIDIAIPPCPTAS